MRARRDEIVTEWARRARASPAARKLDALALNDFIPALLDRIATALEDSSGADATVDDVAAEHALERLSEGYDVASAAAEFVTLRETVLDLSERLPAVPLTPGEARVLNRAIDEALVASVARFARAHQRTLAALDRVSSAALGSGDVDQFLPRLLAVLLETTAAADVAFVLLRGDDDVLHVRAAAGAGAELAGLAARMGEGFAGTIAGSVEPLTSRDASTDPLVTDPAFRGLGVHALYGVPLVHEGRVMGVAGMGSRSAWELSREDEQLFRTMAQRATSLIVQSGLVASRRKAQEELSRDASSRKRAEERLKRIQDRLRARREVERKLIAIVSHDLRNPLHAILLGAQTLLAEPGLDERTVRSLERIRTSAGRASRLVQDLLDGLEVRGPGRWRRRARRSRTAPCASRPPGTRTESGTPTGSCRW
ncbi:MAG TPA: GAF domain-containing protein [Anaeromyxobacter sp.]